jgi:chitin synthase
MTLKVQKYSILFLLFIMNTSLISTFILFQHRWYVYLVILASSTLLYSLFSISLLINKLFTKENKKYDIQREELGLDYVYLVPCYNESYYELINTFISILYQRKSMYDKRTLIVVCDGMVVGKNNNKPTNEILLEIFNNKQSPECIEYYTREGIFNKLYLYRGIFHNLPYILIIKRYNAGKRDSLVLVRKFIYDKTLMNNEIKYIIGVDADTVLDYNCSYELIKTIESDNNIHGCVGYVDINLKNVKFNLLLLYQYAEYMFAQCLKRQAQSHLTHKVNCLSGCNQILRVSEETCGEEIMDKFNYCPTDNDNIFTHIRSIASEDRNHVTLLLSMYPTIKTVQNLNAIAYTNAPTTFKIFLSQRRRWSLGAICNDLLLIKLPNIKLLERILSCVNVSIFSFTPFIILATAFFIKALIENPSKLMLYLSILMIIPFCYGLLIPIFIKPMIFKNALYFYFSYIFFLVSGSFINFFIFFYSLLGMDNISWGKTRQVAKDATILYIDESSTDYIYDEEYIKEINRETEV